MHKNATILSIGAIFIALCLLALPVATIQALRPTGIQPNRLLQDNTPPVATDLNVDTNEDTPLNFNLAATDGDGDSLTYTIITPPVNGTVSDGAGAPRTYTPSAHFNGNDSFTYQANDGQAGSNIATVSITVNPVNDSPSFTKGPNQTKPEDAGLQNVPNWATGISAGPANESGQTLTFNVSNNNTALFSTQPAVAANGTLSYTPAPNAFGDATVTVTLRDNGGTANGGVDTSASQTFTITVNPVNDPPSFTKGANQTVPEDDGPQTVPSWATNISPGPNENDQTVTFTVTTNNNPLFTTAGRPAISPAGTLTFTPANNAGGNATVTVTLKDNGGTANGGEDTSPSQTFTITITAVNDQPSLDLNGGSPGTGYTTSFVFGGDPVAVTGSNLTITDIDDGQISTATVSITNRKHGAKERLTATTNGSGIVADFDADNGVLTLTGPASIADFQTVLRTVRYRIEPDVTNVDTTQRSINFWVNDGQSNSNVAEAKVTIINPRIQLSVEPENQTVFKGETAFFKVTVNNAGNTDLTNVVIKSEAVPACDETFAELKPNQSEEIICFVSNVTQPIDNVITAKADEIQSVQVTATVTARVRLPADIVVNIAPNPAVGNVIIRGQSAVFDITIRNPLQDSTIKSVQVETTITDGVGGIGVKVADEPEPAPEECSPDIGDLAPGQQIVFTCTIPNVQSSFVIQVDASGFIDNIGLTQNTDTSSITMISLVLEAGVSPDQIDEGQATPVVYSLQLNNDGDLPITLNSLQSATHGDLFNPGNIAVDDNTCPDIEKIVAAGEGRSCTYAVTLEPVPGDFTIPNPITLKAESGGVNIAVEDIAIVRVGEDQPVKVDLTASPDILTAPGGPVNLTVVVTNMAEDPVALETLTDSILGDLNGVGDCQTPTTIPVGEEYVCAYQVAVVDKLPGDQVSFKVTATTSLGQIDDSATVSIVELPPTRYLMPVVTNGAVAGETHNTPCRAMPIQTDLAHYFLPDDPNDWYRFTLPSSRRVIIRMTNYVADGQIVIFSGDCASPAYIQNNGNNKPEKEVDIGVRPATDAQGQPINYYVWIVTDGKFNTTTPYVLRIITSAP
jgi:hypothetical protein